MPRKVDRQRASAAAVARELGVSNPAVHYALKSGRISANADGTFDIDRVKTEWVQNTSPTAGGRRTKPGEPPAVHDEAPTSLLEARTLRESYEAQLAKLKYEETRGTLINKAGAMRAIDTGIRHMRDAVLNVPDRLPFERAQQLQVRDALIAALTDASKTLPEL